MSDSLTVNFIGGRPVSSHSLETRPQPIADQWLGLCSCGWRVTASAYQFASRKDALDHIATKFARHIDEAWLADLSNAKDAAASASAPSPEPKP